MSVIAENYYLRMKKGDITNLNAVPKHWRDEVREQLIVDNFVINEDGTVTDMNP